MQHVVSLNELYTLIVGLSALIAGTLVTSKIPGFKRLSLPISVSGGVLVALLVAVVRISFGVEVVFATEARDVLLLVFFTTVGLSAKISALKAGGRVVAVVCALTVVLLVVQNLVGVGIALVRGVHPFYGLLIGSLSFVGGPGTAIAWAKEAAAVGLPHAAEVALGAATLATLAGALVAPYLTGWLVRRNGLGSVEADTGVPWKGAAENLRGKNEAASQMQMVGSLLLILVAVAIGDWLNNWARSADIVMPGFLTAMLAGVLIANVGDLFGRETSFAVMDRGGALALQLFLALSLMGLQLWVVLPIMGPLLLNVALQVAISSVIALVVLFRVLGRDYDAAVTTGGFMGFGLASMPVAFATMDEVTARYGPSAKAFLTITLAGSFFVDLANAVVTKAFLMLPIFR